MEILYDVLEESPVAEFSSRTKSLILIVFAGIVGTLIAMLVYIMLYGSELHFSFGY
ncbi:MAG: hypothetical protein HKP38_00190 [Croceitalea sp.]|nr:hypothetical protein [Croceitalea sp.]